MKYDFVSQMDRKGHDASAVDVLPMPGVQVKDGFSVIPMWIADMNFPTFPGILEAVSQRVSQPHFGYFLLPENYFHRISWWQEHRYGIRGIPRECIGYENGVLGCVSSAIQTFTSPGESVLLHSPAYVGFTKVLANNGRQAVFSSLVQDEEGVWRMDYEDMDRKLRENHIHTAIFCSPHNPAGRVWEREEIEKAMRVYAENDCIVISDEIWADLTLFGNRHIPTQSISQDARNRTIAAYAPSKTFSLAGLVGSYHVIYNKRLRDQMEKNSSLSHYNTPNVLSVHALMGAYTPEGAEWTDQLCQVLGGNVEYACQYIREHFAGVSLFKPQGTYMLYLDCKKWLADHETNMDDLLRKGIEVGVVWQDGRPFGCGDTIRMNLAVPFSMLKEAMDRLNRYVF